MAAQTPEAKAKAVATKQRNIIAKREAKEIADQDAALEERVKLYQRSGVEPVEKAYDIMMRDMGFDGEEHRQHRYECFAAAWRDWRTAQDAKYEGQRVDRAAKDEAYADVAIDVDSL